MDASVSRLEFRRLAVPTFIIVVAAFAAMRWLGVGPWNLPAFDLWAYWLTRSGVDYSAQQGATGAYLYSPVFAQLIAPLTALPWPVFAGLWTALIAAPLLWLAGRRAILLVVLPPVLMSVALGQLDLLFAVVAIVGLRWPVAWVLPILTKVTPGIGIIWFLVRRDWRSLALVLTATAVVVSVSAAADPGAWTAWLAMLVRMDFPALGGDLWFLPIPLWFRLPVAAMLIAWGATTNRQWVLPIGMFLSLPTVWLNSPTILVGLLPLVAGGARTPAAAWLSSDDEATNDEATGAVDRRRSIRWWVRRVAAQSRATFLS